MPDAVDVPTAEVVASAVQRFGGRNDTHGGHPRWWVTNPDAEAAAEAARIGLVPTRTLLQMRRPLPLEPELLDAPTAMSVRSFDPDRDTEALLDINNRAFAWHPDQGGWTAATLDERMREPWFDLDGFRVAEIEGELAGFCWTKLHGDVDPLTGEIYVIAIAPEHRGKGLGLEMTVAGLRWLSVERSAQLALLYVESDNAAAIGTYERLGFETTDIDVAFQPPTDQP